MRPGLWVALIIAVAVALLAAEFVNQTGGPR